MFDLKREKLKIFERIDAITMMMGCYVEEDDDHDDNDDDDVVVVVSGKSHAI